MNRIRVTKSVFLERLYEKYGDKITHIGALFDFYDKGQEFNCKIHGDFTCVPSEMLRKGRIGCSRCGRESSARKNTGKKKPTGVMLCERHGIFGVGYRDIVAHCDGKPLRTAKMWYALLARCYCEKTQEKNPTYIGCNMSEDWLTYSKFKADVEKMAGYDKKGWELDKDVLIEGNKTYSFETCLFLPKEINAVFKQPTLSKKGLPTGILPYTSKKGVRYRAYCSAGNRGVRVYLGSFETLGDAENAYLRAKYVGIVRLCEKYSSDLSLETKNAVLEQAKRKTLDKISAKEVSASNL